MASFLTWTKWLELKESNARKRAIRAALNGTGTPLPGSYAACPSTNPQAMDVAAKTGKVQKKKIGFEEVKGSKPDYSFDRWVQMADDMGKDVNALVGHAKEEEKELDKKQQDDQKKIDQDKSDQDKKNKDEKKNEPEVKPDEHKQKLMKKLQSIAKQPKSKREPEDD